MADESSSHFSTFHVASGRPSLRAAAEASERAFVNAAVRALEQSARFDGNVTKAFALSAAEAAFVNQEVGLHPTSHEGSATAVEVARLFHLTDEGLMAEAVSRHGSKRWFTKKSYFVDRRLEIICHLLAISPSAFESLLSKQPITVGLDEFARSIVSEALGFAIGRWDIRYAMGEKAAPELLDPFAPLPVCPPGQLQNTHGLPVEKADVQRLKTEGKWNYPIEIPWDGILVDDASHALDIEARLRQVVEIIWSAKGSATPHPGPLPGRGGEGMAAAEAIEHEACEILGVKSLRDHFRKPGGFFADHLKRYSKSCRQAPIYWPLSTKSGSYTLWIYYHRLNDQTLHQALADFVDPKIKSLERDIAAWRERAGGGGSQIGELQEFLDELKEFHAEIARIIKLPWKPNLNDGVLITASPLWKLFRLPKWRKDLEACWKELEQGDYDWAHLAYTIWPERVKEKCKTDRSLAIAHGLETLCQTPAPSPKAKRGRKKQVELEGLEE